MRLESPDSLASSHASSLTFEEALTSLQDVVTRLEGGELTLDETITNFREGSELAARCQHLLAEAELRVSEVDPEQLPSTADVDSTSFQ
jgi:exodeoxyribonuclease VII small subunit